MLDQGEEYILFATNILVDLIDKFTKQILMEENKLEYQEFR